MSKQYPGGVISKSGVVPTSLSAPGIWSLSDQAAAQATNSWPFVRDPQFNYVTMLLQGDGSATTNNGRGAGVTPVVTPFNSDASTNNFNLSITGDAKPNNFNPYQAGYYSNYFDGSGDYLSIADANALDFAGDFTVECWFYLTGSLGSARALVHKSNTNVGWELVITNGNKVSANCTSLSIASSTSIVANTWYHAALVRSGSGTNNVKLYLNGVQENQGTNTTDTASTVTLGIGAVARSGAEGVNPFPGYISNVRAVASAVYTSAFTPSTIPLTAITNTVLLTCQSNRFIDNSTNNFTITKNGDTAIATAQPFTLPSSVETYGSAYFDASGDYLTADTTSISLGTNNFTMECWVYPTTSGDQIVFDGRSGSNSNKPTLGVISLQLAYQTSGANRILAGSVPQNAWSHLAIVRNSNVIYAYINGVQVGTYSDSSDYGTVTRLRVGCDDDGGPSAFFGGYISNARLVTSAVYTGAFTPSTTPLTAITNTQLLTTQYNGAGNNSGFKDSSQNNFIIARNGNTAQGTFSPYGSNWSNYFDGSGDYLSVANNVALQWSTGDFCVEAWIYPNSVSGSKAIVCKGTNDAGTFDLGLYGNKIELYTTALVFSSTTTISANTWTHVAVTRSGTTLRCFINGALDTTVTSSYNFNNAGTFYVGVYGSASVNYFNGYMSNVRCVKGSAVYTSAFTPSTTPLTAITNTSLLTCADNRFIDDSTNNFTITKNGDVSVQRFSPFVNSIAYNTNNVGGSAYFDGSGDSLKVAYGPQMNLTNQDFAVEFWAYIPTALTNKSFLCQDQGYYQLNFFVDASNNLTVYSYQASTALNFSVSFGAVPIGQWVHIALTRTGSTVAGFLNGVRQNTASFSGSIDDQTGGWYVGSAYSNTGHMTGYLSDVRFTIGANPHGVGTTLTLPTAPLTASSNTQFLGSMTNAGILDNAMMNDLETVGNAQISTSVKKYGSGSIAMTASGDYCRGVQPSNAYDINGGDFTIEFWVNFTSLAADRALISKYGNTAENAGGLGYVLQWVQSSSVLRLVLGVGGGSDALYTWSWTPNTSTWYHVAVTRSGTSGRAFINGTQIGTTSTVSTSDVASSNAIQVGKTHTVAQYLLGYMDDVRITKGVARYTANFTPPTESFKLG